MISIDSSSTMMERSMNSSSIPSINWLPSIKNRLNYSLNFWSTWETCVVASLNSEIISSIVRNLRRLFSLCLRGCYQPQLLKNHIKTWRRTVSLCLLTLSGAKLIEPISTNSWVKKMKMAKKGGINLFRKLSSTWEEITILLNTLKVCYLCLLTQLLVTLSQ